MNQTEENLTNQKNGPKWSVCKHILEEKHQTQFSFEHIRIYNKWPNMNQNLANPKQLNNGRKSSIYKQTLKEKHQTK